MSVNRVSTLKLPPLYTVDKNGKERVWTIKVEGNKVIRTQGLTKGKKQTTVRKFYGKNQNKSNETTSSEQAEYQAGSMWIKQTDKGYVPKSKGGQQLLHKVKDESDKNGGHHANSVNILLGKKTKNLKHTNNYGSSVIDRIPMKAQYYDCKMLDGGKIGEPLNRVTKYLFKDNCDCDEDNCYCSTVFLQRKYDGIRCLATFIDGECYLTSNNKKVFPHLSHIKEQLMSLYSEKSELIGDFSLDGELFCENFEDDDGELLSEEDRFRTIAGCCSLSRKEPHVLEKQINYVIFDLADYSQNLSQKERFDILNNIFEDTDSFNQSVNTPNLVYCGYDTANSHIEILDYHDMYRDQGYEGTMIRSSRLLYSNKRSNFLRKLKDVYEDEYEVIGAIKDKGVGDENFTWICKSSLLDPKTGNYKTFKVKPEGPNDEKIDMYINRDDYIGRFLTVKYQEELNGIPRFGIGKNFRDDK